MKNKSEQSGSNPLPSFQEQMRKAAESLKIPAKPATEETPEVKTRESDEKSKNQQDVTEEERVADSARLSADEAKGEVHPSSGENTKEEKKKAFEDAIAARSEWEAELKRRGVRISKSAKYAELDSIVRSASEKLRAAERAENNAAIAAWTKKVNEGILTLSPEEAVALWDQRPKIDSASHHSDAVREAAERAIDKLKEYWAEHYTEMIKVRAETPVRLIRPEELKEINNLVKKMESALNELPATQAHAEEIRKLTSDILVASSGAIPTEKELKDIWEIAYKIRKVVEPYTQTYEEIYRPVRRQGKEILYLVDGIMNICDKPANEWLAKQPNEEIGEDAWRERNQ